MKLKEISIRMHRSIRHAQYYISYPGVELVGLVEEGENPDDALEELKGDCRVVLDELIEEEREIFNKTRAELIKRNRWSREWDLYPEKKDSYPDDIPY